MFKARILVVVAAFCWGLSGVTMAFIEDATPWQVTFYRAFWFSVSLLFILKMQHFKAAFLRMNKVMVSAGVSLGLCFVCYVIAMLDIGISNAIFLMSTAPIVGTVFTYLIIREPFTIKIVLSIAVAILGVYIIVGGNIGTGSIWGWLAGFGSPLFFGLYTGLLRIGKSGDMEAAMPWAGLTTMTVSLFFMSMPELYGISTNDLFLTAILGAISIGLGFYLYTLGSRHLHASELGLLSLLEIVFGIPLAVLVGGQPITSSAFIGGMIILAAIVYRILFAQPRQESAGLQTSGEQAS